MTPVAQRNSHQASPDQALDALCGVNHLALFKKNNTLLNFPRFLNNMRPFRNDLAAYQYNVIKTL
jgi:hypothetical protein